MAMSVSRRPFRARRGPGRHLGFRRSGSTLGYNPAAASRLPRPGSPTGARDSYPGSRRSGSTPGYNPAAASRLPGPDGHGSVRFSRTVLCDTNSGRLFRGQFRKNTALINFVNENTRHTPSTKTTRVLTILGTLKA